MKVLFTSPVLEHPAAGGPQLRVENSILALERIAELHIVSRATRGSLGGHDGEDFFRNHCASFSYSPSTSGLLNHPHVRKYPRLRRHLSAVVDANFILKTARERGISVIWCGYGNVSYELMVRIKKKSDLTVICDTDSVWSRFVLRELPHEKDPIRRLKIEEEGRKKELEERSWVDLCDITTAVSEVDAAYYRELAKDPGRVRIFSNALNLETYDQDVAPPPDFRNPCIYLAGSFWPSSPMEKAARWIIDEVLPLVRREIPTVHFYIIGKGSREILKDLQDPGITVAGQLPSVLPYLCNADVSLVPLAFESGTRFKILEAAACGIPIISTALGAEGIPVRNGEHVVIADDPEEFAAGIVRIVKDKGYGRKLAENCRELVRNRYGINALAKEAEEILKAVAFPGSRA